MFDFYWKLLEIIFFPLLILASAVGVGVYLKQHKDKTIIALFFILATVIAYGISVEYTRLRADQITLPAHGARAEILHGGDDPSQVQGRDAIPGSHPWK